MPIYSTLFSYNLVQYINSTRKIIGICPEWLNDETEVLKFIQSWPLYTTTEVSSASYSGQVPTYNIQYYSEQ